MKLSQLLGRIAEKAVYDHVTGTEQEQERERNRKQIKLIRDYRAQKRAERERQVKLARRQELIRMGFNPPEVI